MKAIIEQRRNEFCIGLCNLYSQEKELQRQLSVIQASIKSNITAIEEMENLLDQGKG